MRIGNLAITRQRKVKKTIAEQVGDHLVTQDVRDIIARMARSEVKNYLAELAEAAELPFGDAAVFLGLVRTQLVAALLTEISNACKIEVGGTGYPFEVGGYANHPEQAEQDARPFGGDDVHVDWHMTPGEWRQLYADLWQHTDTPYIARLIEAGKIPAPPGAAQPARPWPPSAGLTFSDELLDERVTKLERRADGHTGAE